MSKLADFEIKEVFDGFGVGSTGFHGIAKFLEHYSDASFGILQLIFDRLSIQIGKIRDGSDSSEDGVVTDTWGSWTEGGYHGDSLLSTKCLQCLVINVATLQNHSASLGNVSRYTSMGVSDQQLYL